MTLGAGAIASSQPAQSTRLSFGMPDQLGFFGVPQILRHGMRACPAMVRGRSLASLRRWEGVDNCGNGCFTGGIGQATTERVALPRYSVSTSSYRLRRVYLLPASRVHR